MLVYGSWMTEGVVVAVRRVRYSLRGFQELEAPAWEGGRHKRMQVATIFACERLNLSVKEQVR